MERVKHLLPLAVLLVIIGTNGLFRFSHNVRSVDAVGLSGSGFSLGVAFALLVLGFAGKIKPWRSAD